ncbi:MAG: M3 family oligoendopeptidase [Desulfuromonadales bacterium]|nr:M3 family oligoendopeptidase [Desulfuromonadales bacterium]
MPITQDDNLRWDLAPLYPEPAVTAVDSDLAAALALADTFRAAHHGRIAAGELSATELFTALKAYEDLQRQSLKPQLYAQLRFAGDGRDPQGVRLLARCRDVATRITEQTLFFELELLQLDADLFARLRNDPQLASYGHYLDSLRAHAPYTLAEPVEQALKRKDLSGRDAFVQLFDELTAGLVFPFRFPDEDQERAATGEELLALLFHGEAAVREAAFTCFLEQHAEQSLVLTSCLNNILLDHGKEAELRGYPDLMTPTHLGNETDPAMVEQLLTVSEQHYGLAREYFDLKRRLLGLDLLKNTDLYAPVGAPRADYSFAEAWQLVATSLHDFAPELAGLADRLRRQGRIDLRPRAGKSAGAFCMGLYPGADPYLLLNFTGTLRDVTTLAHELGHALHYQLAGGQNLFDYHAALPLAETASVFGEMLVTRRLLDREPVTANKIALLCAKLEEIIATTFRQTVLTRFEQKAHARRGQGLLASDDLCRLWLEENERLFGDSVSMIPAYRWGWSYISHFVHARFYCYAYVFGELLVLALYQKYREDGAAFVPAYLDLLRAGGAAPPAELLRPLGIDLADPDFWSGGYALVAELLAELRELLEDESGGRGLS